MGRSLDAIPRHRLDPPEGRTTCALVGYGEVRISNLVRRTLELRTAWPRR